MLSFQTNLLKWSGFFPFIQDSPKPRGQLWTKATNVIQIVGAIVILLGAAFSTVIHLITIVDTVTPSNNSTSSNSSHGVLYVLSFIPYVTINSRGMIILFLLLIKRESLSGLSSEISRFLIVCFPSVSQRKVVLKSLERWSIILGTALILTHALYDTFDDVYYYGKIDMLTDDGDSSTWTDLKAWQTLLIWVIFSNIPFVLSQQAYLYPVLLAALLNHAIKELKHELKAAAERVCATKEGEVISEMEVKIWRTKQMAMLKFCGLINDCFNLVLFFTYWSDFLTLLGYTSSFPNISSDEPITTYLRLVFNCILFASYGALIPIPLVCVYENSGSLGFIVYRLKVLIDGRSNSPEEADTVELLEELERVFRSHVCMFNGAKLIYYTRGFLVGITTLVLSVTLIIREFISRP